MGRIVRLLLCMFLLASCSAGDSPGPQRARQAAEVSGSVVMVPGPRAGYVLAPSGTGYTLSDKSGKEAPRTIDRATRLRFTDISVAFDAEGVPGQAYRLYQAAFNRIPDAGGLGYWMRVLDQGAQLPDVASAFVDSAEFKSLYGNAPANADIVGKYYLNVLHRTGEAAGVAYWLDILDSKRATPAQVLAYFSESAENKAAVEVALQAGIPYQEPGVAYVQQAVTVSVSSAVDASTPAAAQAAIVRVVSAAGAGALGSAIPVPTSSTGDALMLALDAQGEVLMASHTAATGAGLSADSTALSLARLFIGAPGAAIGNSQLNEAIRSASGYAELVAAVGAALAAATPPIRHPQVVASLTQMLGHLPASVVGAAPARQGALVDTPAVTKPLPFTLVPDTLLNFLPVGITDVCGGLVPCQGDYKGSHDVGVFNHMPIAWSVSTQEPIGGGTLLLAGAREIIIPANDSLVRALLARSITGYFAKSYGVPGNGGKSFNLTISQSTEAVADNVAAALVQTVDTVSNAFPSTCSAAQLKPAFKALAKAAIEKEVQGKDAVPLDVVRDYMKSFFTLSTTLSVIKNCFSTTEVGGALTPLIKQFDAYYKPLKIAYSATASAALWTYLYHFTEQAPVDFAVCINDAGYIDNCVKKFQFEPAAVAWVAPGVKLSSLVELTALDAAGKRTGIPAGLQWSTDAPSYIKVDGNSGEAVARAAIIGGKVKVQDPVSGVSASYAVAVADPVICPQPIVVPEQGSQLVRLTNGSTADCKGDGVLAAPNTTWLPDDTSLVTGIFSIFTACPSPSNGATVKGSCVMLTGVKKGSTTLRVTNGVTGTVTTARIDVVDKADACNSSTAGQQDVAFTGTYSMPSAAYTEEGTYRQITLPAYTGQFSGTFRYHAATQSYGLASVTLLPGASSGNAPDTLSGTFISDSVSPADINRVGGAWLDDTATSIVVNATPEEWSDGFFQCNLAPGRSMLIFAPKGYGLSETIGTCSIKATCPSR